ncbi:MAG TPA: hypothetical protein VMU99_05990 [Acidimicrobiales bacterium]|nr:hypothetical protein [Acidimicrobiales bacterium]
MQLAKEHINQPQIGTIPVQAQSYNPTRPNMDFEVDRAVAGAGIVLVAIASKRLGTDKLANQLAHHDRPWRDVGEIE